MDDKERQVKWDKRWLAMAAFIAGWSKDPSTKAGAIITENQVNLVSMGYNGLPQSMQDRVEYLNNRDEKYSRIVHAEINALLFSGRPNLRGCTLYVHPFLCCERCAVLVAQAGIERVVAPRPMPDKEERWGASFKKSREYFLECGVKVLEE